MKRDQAKGFADLFTCFKLKNVYLIICPAHFLYDLAQCCLKMSVLFIKHGQADAFGNSYIDHVDIYALYVLQKIAEVVPEICIH